MTGHLVISHLWMGGGRLARGGEDKDKLETHPHSLVCGSGQGLPEEERTQHLSLSVHGWAGKMSRGTRRTS